MAYTNIDDSSAHFQTALYTGTGSQQSITNDGNSDLQPDLLWIKQRSSAQDHILLDSTRGVTGGIFSNTIDPQILNSAYLNSFDSDGFTVKTSGLTNTNTSTYVAWQWKATGGTTVTNTDGSENSTVQANTDAGFSIVQYSGNGLQDQTIGHGLGAVPKMVIYKATSQTAYWYAYHIATGNDTMMYPNLSNAAQSLPSQFSTPTTSTFNVSNENSTFSGYNSSGETYIAYVFAEKQGFSKIGKYYGNGSLTSGPFVYTGFKPAFIMIKAVDAVKNWTMFDNKRLGYNGDMYYLYANTSGGEGESPSSGGHIDLLSNGFKIYDNWSLTNQSNIKYAYIAFAENPFVSSTGIPTTAR